MPVHVELEDGRSWACACRPSWIRERTGNSFPPSGLRQPHFVLHSWASRITGQVLLCLEVDNSQPEKYLISHHRNWSAVWTRVCQMLRETDELKLEETLWRSSEKAFHGIKKTKCSPGYEDHADPVWRLPVDISRRRCSLLLEMCCSRKHRAVPLLFSSSWRNEATGGAGRKDEAAWEEVKRSSFWFLWDVLCRDCHKKNPLSNTMPLNTMQWSHY